MVLCFCDSLWGCPVMAEGKSKPPQDVVAEIGVDDLYEFLGVDSTSGEKEV